jgi:hypothetical protein
MNAQPIHAPRSSHRGVKTPEQEFEWPSDEIADWFAQIDWEVVKRDLAAGPLKLAKIGWFLTGNCTG